MKMNANSHNRDQVDSNETERAAPHVVVSSVSASLEINVLN